MDRFSLDIFRLFSGSRGQAQNLARLHRRFAKKGPQAADGLATSGEGNRRASGSSQIPSQRYPMGHSVEWEALWGSVRLNPPVLSEIVA